MKIENGLQQYALFGESTQGFHASRKASGSHDEKTEAMGVPSGRSSDPVTLSAEGLRKAAEAGAAKGAASGPEGAGGAGGSDRQIKRIKDQIKQVEKQIEQAKSDPKLSDEERNEQIQTLQNELVQLNNQLAELEQGKGASGGTKAKGLANSLT